MYVKHLQHRNIWVGLATCTRNTCNIPCETQSEHVEYTHATWTKTWSERSRCSQGRPAGEISGNS
jgi:hypothetical protein